MSINVNIVDSKILLKIPYGISRFEDLLLILKSYHCRFNPDYKCWEIPRSNYESILDDVSNVIIIDYPKDFDSKIHSLLISKSEITHERQEFTINDLKLPYYQGKHPYERYQLEDILRLISTNRYALYLDPGLGKSYIFLSALEYLRKIKLIKKILIVTSGSGVYNLTKEISKFTNIDASKVVIGGVKNRRPFDDITSEVVVTNYRSFLVISDEYYKQPKLISKTGKPTKRKVKEQGEKLNYNKTRIPILQWLDNNEGAIILDESHFIANPDARQTKALHQVKQFFKFRYLASGTPADTLEKYYSQLKFLDSSLVYNFNYYEWLQYYCNLGNEYSEYYVNSFKSEKTPELIDLVKSVAIRRIAEETIDLPEHLIKCIYVEFTEKQQQLYKKIIDYGLNEMKDEYGSIETTTFKNKFQLLTSAIDNPDLLLHYDTIDNDLRSQINNFNFIKDHSKMEALDDLMEKHKNSKIIIWTTHPSVGFKLAEYYKKLNPLVINGESEKPKGKSLDEFKSDIVEEFQHNHNRHLLIAGTQVMNTSITLVKCNVQIVFDINNNYTQYEQSLKRIHRIGQSNTVYTYIILIDYSLDALRYEDLLNKDFINKNFLNSKYLDFLKTQEMINFTSNH
jgi:SNF2 family DNA or RNA helicase